MAGSTSATSILLYGADVVLPDRVLTGGAVRIADGRIAEVAVSRRTVAGPWQEAVDASGLTLLPGVIDLHNDSLETEINPRPDANLPLPFALANLERRLLNHGVTTEFHAIGFQTMPRSGRTVADAEERAAYLAELVGDDERPVDHHVLHRLDVWSPHGFDSLYASLGRFPTPYLSINDHTPGQGQYRDLDGYVERMRAWTEARGGTPPTAEETLAKARERREDSETLPGVYARISAEQDRRPHVIASHDDDSPQKVDQMWHTGARVAEFPVTLGAARRARERGMWIVAGAPNIVRGGSTSGNLDARELVKAGLADVLCADYHAPSLLCAAFLLVNEGLLDLPHAVRMLTLNAAQAVGFGDRGAIHVGLRADLALVSLDGDALPHVERVYRGGREVLRTGAAPAHKPVAAR